MNTLKRLLGFVWIALGPAIIFYLCMIAMREITNKPTADTIIQWSVFVFISIPIGVGLVIFGRYAIKGEYSQLPSKSEEL